MDRASRPGNAGCETDGLPASGSAVSRHKPVQQSPPTPEAGLPQARGILGQFQGARAARSRARYSDPGTLVDRHEVGSQRTGQNDGISLACGTHSSVGNGWIP